MKKAATILFAFIYLQASVGVAINVHYCMGQLANAGVFVDSKGCVCEDFEQEGDCCDDESYFYQLDDNQDFVKSVEVKSPFAITISLPKINVKENVETAIKVNKELFDLSPPPKQPIWLITCSPTFYG